MVEGGEARNVIPESVTIGGTFRSLTGQGLLYLQERIKEVKPSLLQHIIWESEVKETKLGDSLSADHRDASIRTRV